MEDVINDNKLTYDLKVAKKVRSVGTIDYKVYWSQISLISHLMAQKNMIL